MENKGSNNKNNGGNKNGGNNKNGMTALVFIAAALMVLFLTSLLNSCARNATNKEISYSEFINMVENGKVEQVTFTSSRIEIVPKTSQNTFYRITYYTAELNDENLLPLLKEHNVRFGGTVEDLSSVLLWNFASYILPLVIVWVLLYFFIFRKMGGGGVMGVGKNTAKVYVEKSTGVTFKDVAGQDEAKESLQEVVDFLHNPKKYADIGAKLPKGALLVGPPGTGKTLLAKAVAGEAKVPFFSLAGSDFVEMFVGVGASRVRDLFKEAQKQAPCIIFIDEIDAIGKSRDTRYGGNDEREQTLNQLLSEMDGFDTSKGLLILAATNRPEVLDKALLRPGRFDRRIIVDKPDLKGRVETLKVHAKHVLMDDTVDLDAIGLATSGAVGSDLANMINEAAINAVKHGRRYVNQNDLFESVEVVIAGKEKKDRIMGPKEKKMVAYHEVGHALVTALQKDAEPVQKITIVPRTMGALGYTMQVPEEEKFLMTKNELLAHIVTYMGGRAAEEIVFDSVTTGASNDIEQATKMARAMVTQYGMSEKFGLMGLVTVESQYLDGRASLNCGEETAAQIDQEVMRILKESYQEATRLLEENRDILDEIAGYLYDHETITGKEFMKIFRRLKGLPEPEEKTDAEKAAEEFKAEKSEAISKGSRAEELEKWEERSAQIGNRNALDEPEWKKADWKPLKEISANIREEYAAAPSRKAPARAEDAPTDAAGPEDAPIRAEQAGKPEDALIDAAGPEDAPIGAEQAENPGDAPTVAEQAGESKDMRSAGWSQPERGWEAGASDARMETSSGDAPIRAEQAGEPKDIRGAGWNQPERGWEAGASVARMETSSEDMPSGAGQDEKPKDRQAAQEEAELDEGLELEWEDPELNWEELEIRHGEAETPEMAEAYGLEEIRRRIEASVQAGGSDPEEAAGQPEAATEQAAEAPEAKPEMAGAELEDVPDEDPEEPETPEPERKDVREEAKEEMEAPEEEPKPEEKKPEGEDYLDMLLKGLK